MKTFIIGDIHGCYDELITLFEKASIKENDFILSLGDIVDRGPKSKEVYHFFKSRSNAKVLMGNHERKHISDIMSYAQEIVKLQFGEEYPEFVHWAIHDQFVGKFSDGQKCIIRIDGSSASITSTTKIVTFWPDFN